MKTAAILLAAGRASRFGAAKLAADLGGQALASHAAKTLRQLPLAAHIAVTSPATPDLTGLGFDCVTIDPPDAPLSRSLALGVARALAGGAQQVLIALADMPFVPLAHFEALLAASDGRGIATISAGQAMPPALFGPEVIAALQGVQGDHGARQLLSQLPGVVLAPELALDIDTAADLASAEGYLRKLSSRNA